MEFGVYKMLMETAPPTIRDFVSEVIADGFTDDFTTFRLFAEMDGSAVYAELDISELVGALYRYGKRKGLSVEQIAHIRDWIQGLEENRHVNESIDRFAAERGWSAEDAGKIREWFSREMAGSGVKSILKL